MLSLPEIAQASTPISAPAPDKHGILQAATPACQGAPFTCCCYNLLTRLHRLNSSATKPHVGQLVEESHDHDGVAHI